MPEIVQYTMTALCAITQGVTIGTNLALLQFMWMLVSGALLPSRGAVFPALQAVGLVPAAVRRAWAALHSGDWHIADLLTAWNQSQYFPNLAGLTLGGSITETTP